MADRGVLHHNHRFTGCTEPPHFHCRGNECVGLAGAYFVGEYLRLHGAAYHCLCLVRTQRERLASHRCYLPAEVLGYKLVGYLSWDAVVEAFIIYGLYASGHFGVCLHTSTCPVLEIVTYLIEAVGAYLGSLSVGNGFRFTSAVNPL